MEKKRKKCPFCGVEVNKENLDKHITKVHGELDEEEFEKKGLKKPIATSSKKKTQVRGKKGSRKRKPKKKDRTSVIMSIIALIIIAALVGTVIYTYLNQNGGPKGDSGNGNGGGKRIAVMTTTLGTIKIELDLDKAPITAGNFIDLTNSGFYNGVIFHRVIPGFVIQGGGFISDGSQKNADSVSWEDTGLLNSRYTISMARSGNASDKTYKNTGSSQFFINLADNTDLDEYTYPYVVFGRVIEGFNVVDAIAALPTDSNDWPDDPPVINSVVIED